MIRCETAENRVQEKRAGEGGALTPGGVQVFREGERVPDPADEAILQAVNGAATPDVEIEAAGIDSPEPVVEAFSGDGQAPAAVEEPAAPEVKTKKNPSKNIDFAPFFADYHAPDTTPPSPKTT